MAIKNERDWVNHKPLCCVGNESFWVGMRWGEGKQGEQEDWDEARLKM